MRTICGLLVVVLAVTPAFAADVESETPPAPTEPAKEIPAGPPPNMVKLQGLNKTTARISTIEATLGTVERFGNLEIIAHRCWRSPADERPENAALLEIRELKPGEGPVRVFQGWMFSSNPAYSALEHPIYDVTVLGCVYKEIKE